MKPYDKTAILSAWETYLSTSLDQRLTAQQDASQQALERFHAVSATVPAYRAFLAEQGIDPEGIKTFADFQQLPPLTKENYLQCHPLPDLCRDGKLEACDMIAVSSGSTGK